MVNYGTMMVSCGIDYNAYVIESFINSMVQYYGLLDTDTIYINDVLYTKRWVCNATGICSQISSGYGYASEALCKGAFPCNPNQWKINTPTLTGTVNASGNVLTWSLTPKSGIGVGTVVNFDFGNSINYDGVGMIPVTYTDSTGTTQIGVYQSGAFAGASYAMNTSYHGGSADFYLLDSDVNIAYKIPGYAWTIQCNNPTYCGITTICTNPLYKCADNVCTSDNCDGTGTFPTNACGTGCGGTGCIPSYIGTCRQPLNGYEYDVNSCPGSVDRLNSKCNSGTVPPVVGKVCNDPMKWGCTYGIPNTYVIVGAFAFMMMMQKQ
jgi:hypothetical protein